MTFTKPTSAILRPKRHTSYLTFEDKSLDHEAYMRGAICWPTPDPKRHNAIVGYVLIAGFNVSTRRTTVYEEHEFYTVDHVLNDDQTIQAEGVSTMFNLGFTKYFCDTYFWNHPGLTHRKYRKQVYAADMIKPKPHFIEAHWHELAQVEQIMYEKLSLENLITSENETLAMEGKLYDPLLKRATPPMHALFCLLAGMERWSWREPPADPETEAEVIWARRT